MPNLGTSKQQGTSTQAQQSTTAPWAPTQELLGNILYGIGNQYMGGQTNPTAAETAALTSLQNSAAATPDYTSQANGLVGGLLGGGGANQYAPMAQSAYNTLQSQLNPYASGQYLDPTQAPGMQSVLDTIRSDVSNSVNGLFAGAGRDLSGAHTQTLARGIAQGEAAPLLNQYQQNQGIQQNAINNLYSAGNTTAGLLTGLNQTGLSNAAQGLGLIPSLSSANAGANATLQAGQTARGLPLSNIGNVLNLLLPIAGLGSQSQGTAQGTSTQYNTMSPIAQATAIGNLFGNVFGGGTIGKGIGNIASFFR